MNTTTAPTFTEQDIRDLAALIGPAIARMSGEVFATPAQRLEAVVALAAQNERDDFESRTRRLSQFTEILSGTYDEFRAEAIA